MGVETEYKSLAQRITAIEETLAAAGIVIKAQDDTSTLPELTVDSSKAIWNYITALQLYDVLAFATCSACSKDFEFTFRASQRDADGMERVVRCSDKSCGKRFRTRVWHKVPAVPKV